MENKHKRYVKTWHFLSSLTGGWIDHKFNYTHDMSELDRIGGPVILIPNHACDWDPVLIGIASKNRQFYFVMSEHMVRVPAAGKLIKFFFDPILKKKGAPDIEVVISCYRHIQAGHSVCLFAEGDQCWDGVSGKIIPATGNLVKACGATLVTYRLEGSFLSLPRWGKGARRGRVEGRIAGIYTPDEIEKMSAEEVCRTIERDLYFDIGEWQRSMPAGPVEFKGRRKNRDYAKGLDMLFFMCPGCGSIGTLNTMDDEIFCRCGFRARFLNTGFLEPVSPAAAHPPYDFTTLPGWDAWQREELVKRTERILAEGSQEGFFEDGPVKLSRVERDHSDTVLSKGDLSLSFRNGKAVMSAGDRSFVLNEIKEMGLVLSGRILFSYGTEYYQIRSRGINIMKYQLMWRYVKDK